MFFVLLLQISFQYLSPSLEKRIEVFNLVALLMGLGLMMGISIGGTDRMGASGSGFQRYFFQMSVLIRKTANAIRIMTASEVNIQLASGGVVWFNCLNSLLVLNSPLYLVLSPWISSAKAFCHFSGTVLGFHLDHHCLRFVCRDHMMHGPNVASWINQDCVS
jgi:hypothetical protein